MPRPLVRLCAVLSIALGLTASAAQAQQFTIPVNDSFVESVIQTTGGMAPPYYYNWYVAGQDGRLVLCGVGYLRDGRLRQTIRGMLRDARIEVNGQLHDVDARFFARAPSRQSIASSQANCQVLPIAAPGGSTSIAFGLGRGTWRN